MYRAKRTTKKSERVREALLKTFCEKHPSAKVEVYQFNPHAIRVRVLFPGFEKLDRVERDQMVRPLLNKELDSEILKDITMLLLITPDETRESLVNLEFEHPRRSML